MHFSWIAIITALIALTAAAPLHSSGNRDVLTLDRRVILTSGNSNILVGRGEKEENKKTAYDTEKMLVDEDKPPEEIKKDPPKSPTQELTLVPAPQTPTPETPTLPLGVTGETKVDVDKLLEDFTLFRGTVTTRNEFKMRIYQIVVSCSKLA